MIGSTGAKAGCIALYIILIAIIVITGVWIPLVLVLALHLVEFFVIVIKLANAHRIPLPLAFIKCMIFGITWWKPLRDQNKPSRLE